MDREIERELFGAAGDGACRDGSGVDRGDGRGAERYGAGNVVLVEVEHLRAYLGEHGGMLYRMRTADAEDEVMRAVLDGRAEPDWFVERWVDGADGFGEAERGAGVLVACLVFEREEAASACRAALAEALRDGGVKRLRLRDDAAMAADVAAWFSARWGEAHAAEMAKVDAAYAAAMAADGARIVVGWIGGGDDAAMRKRRFGAFGEWVKGRVEGLVDYSGVDDDVLGRVNVAFGFEDAAAADRFLAMAEGEGSAAVADFGGVFFRIEEGMRVCDVLRQMVVGVSRRLAKGAGG